MAPRNKTTATSTSASIIDQEFETATLATSANGVSDKNASDGVQGLKRSKRTRRPPQTVFKRIAMPQEMAVRKKTGMKRKSTSTPKDQNEPKAKKRKADKKSKAATSVHASLVAVVPPLAAAQESMAKIKKRLNRWAKQGENPKYHGPWWKSTNDAYPNNKYIKKSFQLRENPPQSRKKREDQIIELHSESYSLLSFGCLTEHEAEVSRRRLLESSLPEPPLAGIPPEHRRQFNLDLQAFQLFNGLGPLENLPRPYDRRVRHPRSPVRTTVARLRFKRGPWSAEICPGGILKFKRFPWSVERVFPKEEICDEESAESDSDEDDFCGFPWIARPRKAFHERDHVYGPGESPEDIIWIPKGKEADSDEEDSASKASDEADPSGTSGRDSSNTF